MNFFKYLVFTYILICILITNSYSNDKNSNIKPTNTQLVKTNIIKDNFTNLSFSLIETNNTDIKSFYISTIEVTQKLWKTIMQSNPSHFRNGDDYPVENISFLDVKKFLKKVNSLSENKYTIPTIKQWNYIVKNGKQDISTNMCKYANLYDQTSYNVNKFDNPYFKCEDGFAYTSPVGNYEPNFFGIYDIFGNVSEFICNNDLQTDCYIVGGNFSDGIKELRSYPQKFYSTKKFGGLGFRLIMIPANNKILLNESKIK